MTVKYPEIKETLVKVTLTSGGVIFTQPVGVFGHPLAFPPDQKHLWKVISYEQGQIVWRAEYTAEGVPIGCNGLPTHKNREEFLADTVPRETELPEPDIGKRGPEPAVLEGGGPGPDRVNPDDAQGA